MARETPLVRSFNAGEFSPMMEGRTDVDRYTSSCRILHNAIAAPQGPAVCRSGTAFIARSFANNRRSVLIPFSFSEEEGQSYMMEFTHQRVRFFTEDALLTRAPVSVTGVSASPFVISSSALASQGLAVGDQIVLSGLPFYYNLNFETATVVAKSGDNFTLDLIHPDEDVVGTFQAAFVYSIPSPYTESQLDMIRDLQSLDVVYLFHPDVPVTKLMRRDTYDWSFETVSFIDGPYMDVNETSTRLTPAGTGNAVPNMTADNAPTGWTASSSGAETGAEAFRAFDAENHATWWRANTEQTGSLEIQSPTPIVVDAYSIYVGLDNKSTSYLAKDYAPYTFELLGSNDGTSYVLLDRQNAYVLYDDNKSVMFELDNATAYSRYRIRIFALTRNGDIKPTIGRLVLRSATSRNITINASSTVGINADQGFLATDVGRDLRIQGRDGVWRPMKITQVNSTTQVVARLEGEPFTPDEGGAVSGVTKWRLGHWSGTSGYPSCGTFFEDRLFMGGSKTFPDLIVASNSQDYENMMPSDPDGTVLDTHSIVRRLNARRLSQIKWLAEGDKGLMCGTGSREWLITTVDGSGKNVTPDNLRAVPTTSRGSADVDVIPIDSLVIFIPRGGRTAREFAYSFEADGFKSPSMSLLSNHIGATPFVRMAYSAEPYSIIWMLRADGSLAGLTYNRDENVVGWHRHDFSGRVDSIAVLPSSRVLQDELWMVVVREINGQEERYVEKLMPFWDFNMRIEEAHFVDSALRYEGPKTDVVFGLQHLEGRNDIYGLADTRPVGPLSVVNGTVSIPTEAENIILGIGFESIGETSRLENGARDGTAQGKVKRFNRVTVNVWESYGGLIGTWNEDTQEVVFSVLEPEYPTRGDQIEEISLYSGLVGPIVMEPGYEKQGTITFKREKAMPLPFNIVALMPQMVTQDGG